MEKIANSYHPDNIHDKSYFAQATCCFRFYSYCCSFCYHLKINLFLLLFLFCCCFCFVVVVVVLVVDDDVLVLYYPRNLPLKFGQNRVSNRRNVAFVVVVVVIVHIVIAIVVVDFTNLPLKFGQPSNH